MLHCMTSLLVLIRTLCPAEPPAEIAGKITDQKGNPCPRCKLTGAWWFDAKGEAYPISFNLRTQFISTDDNGFFHGQPGNLFPTSVFAIDPTGQYGVIFPSDHARTSRFVAQLKPLATVCGRLTSVVQLNPIERGGVIIRREGGIVANFNIPPNGAFRVKLPAGNYSVGCQGDSYKTFSRTFKIDSDVATLDLGDMRLEASVLAALSGKPPPAWNITAAEGAPVSLRLQDLRDRWVLIAIWNSNQGTFVPPQIQELFEFEKHRWHVLTERLQIIAFHDKTVTDSGKIKDLLGKSDTPIRTEDERGIILLFDSTGKTLKDWGIESIPRLVLIDPAGNIVDCGDEKPLAVLKKKVQLLGEP